MKRCCIVVLITALFIVSGCNPKVEEPTAPVPPPEEEGEMLGLEEVADEMPEEGGVSPVTDYENWTVTASSQEDDFTPDLAADGSLDTRWSSEWANDQWLQIDFGREELVGVIVLHWETAFAKAYRVEVSTDGETWDEVYKKEDGRGGEKMISFDPRPVRYTRILCDNKATKWGFSLMEVAFNPAPDLELVSKVTASSGSGDYVPEYAVDGDPSTRWSSNFGDTEWWQIRFPEVQRIGGMKILWETAFAEKYQIEVSIDGENWETVYSVVEGDGQTDYLFFGPVDAQFLKVQCLQRGTGWGNSIHEIEFYADDEMPTAGAQSSLPDAPAGHVIDGDPNSLWQTEAEGEQSLVIELPATLSLGGVQITWGDDFATKYRINVSGNKEGDWQTVSEVDRGNGVKDFIFFPAASSRRLEIECLESGTGNGYAIAEVEFKSGEEQATPLRHYKAAAKDSPRGWYPRWLLREQEFWTVTGVIDDEQETLISESGTIEPHKGDFCVMPFVMTGGDLISWGDVELEQGLEKKALPMPWARWNADDWSLKVEAVAYGEVGESSTTVRYRFENKGEADFSGRLALAVRPIQLNPVWQHGGFSPMQEVVCAPEADTAHVRVNGNARIICLSRPDAMGAAPFTEGDVVTYLADGGLPESLVAQDKEGKTSAAWTYDLNVEAGGAAEFVVVFLLHDDSKISQAFTEKPRAGFEKVWTDQLAFWDALLSRFSITCPEQRLIDILKSNLAYILINKDGPWIKPGSRNYAHAWIRDGAMTSVTLLRMGIYEPVKQYIEAYTELVNEQGWCPYIILQGGNPVNFNPDPNSGEGQEFDSQGQYPFLVRQYFDFTGDEETLAAVWPDVKRALEYGRKLRRARMTDEYKNDPEKKAYYGILPHSNSHEGYFPAKHSYWDDFWMLRGFKDGAYLAEIMGEPETAAWMRQEETDLREALLASIMMVIERDGLDHIPGCVELGDFDATSTAIAIMACGEQDYLPEPYKSRTFERYYEDFKKGMEPGGERTFTPYEVRSADAFVRMGKRYKGLAMLRYFIEDSVRPYGWNHFAEVVHARPRAPSYIGDMPHTWVGSGYISAVRSIFAYEHEGALIVAAGIDPQWAGEGVTVEKLPTQYGLLDYTVRATEDGVVIAVSGDAAPPEGFSIPLPSAWSEKTVTIDGEPVDVEGGVIEFENVPVEITLSAAE